MAAGPGYGTRANPSYWEKVFEAFPMLHVNMAHFGGFDEAFKDKRLNLGAISQTWEWTIGRMSAANPNLPIYADVSYFSDVLQAKSQLRKDVLACMKQFKKSFPDSHKVLLYGTDWSMIGREQTFGQSYARQVAEFLREAGYDQQDHLENIFFRNSARFLGLRPSDKEKGNRGRLERFYANPADAAWLSNFDQIA
jgi:predicted TIM-barrel fold metal-dependent hydrolase